MGVADHSGWANLVTMATDGDRPTVLDRRRCELVGPDVSRQPYHAADGLDDDEAAALVARVRAAAGEGARGALIALVGEIADTYRVVAVALRAGGTRPLPDTVAGVLASHSAMHAAEGQLYRDAIADAAGELGLTVATYARGAAEAAAPALGATTDELSSLVAAMGRRIGPPWRQEHREAATAALGELAAYTPVALDA